MPDNPYSSYFGGQLLMQGMSNFGQSIGQGVQGYLENKQKDALAQGQIEPYLPSLMASQETLSPEMSKMVDRFMNHKASLADKMALVGNIQTMQVKKQQDAENQARVLQYQTAQTENQLKQAELSRYLQQNQGWFGIGGQPGGQGQGQGGSPAPGGYGTGQSMTPRPAAPQNMAPPVQPAPITTTPGATLNPPANPRNWSPNAQADMQAQIRQGMVTPTEAGISAAQKERADYYTTPQHLGGYGPIAPNFDKDGNATSYKVGKIMQVPGQKPYIDAKDAFDVSGQGSSGVNLFDPQTGRPFPNVAAAFGGADYNPKAEGAQVELADSWREVNKAREALGKANFYKEAVEAYAKDPITGNSLNALLATDTGKTALQVMTGKAPAAAVQAAMGELYQNTVQSLQNDKTGGNAIRNLTQQELARLQAQYGSMGSPAYVQKALAGNYQALKQREVDMRSDYANARQSGVKPADADMLIAKKYSTPLAQVVPQAVDPSKIPKPYIARLRQAAADPAVRMAFDKRFGAGASDFILNGK